VLEVPRERVAARAVIGIGGEADELLAVVGVVAAAVVVVGAEAVGDADDVVGGDADVAVVEEGVELLGEDDAFWMWLLRAPR
jgi:hypothetical protein